MKKKLALVIVALVALTAILVGCISKPPHKMFSDPWSDYEKITYEVTRTLKDADKDDKNNKKITGESVMITERLNNKDIQVGNKNIKNFSGTLVSIETSLEDGSIMKATVAFKASFEPVASYKHIEVKGYEHNSPAKDTKQTIQMYYNDEKCYYETDIDGVKSKSDEKVGKWIKTPYFDNLMLYHIVRSSYLKDNFSSISTKVMSVDGFKLKTLTATATAPLVIKLDKNNKDDKGIKCDLIKIALQQKFPGSGEPMTVTLSREIKKDGYAGMKLTTERVPLIITEGTMAYQIKEFTTSK